MPGQMVSVKVQGGESFCIHKDVLIKQSVYFAKALDGPFREGQTNSIDLDDISAKDFGLYVRVMYASVVHRNCQTLRDVWPLDVGNGPLHHPWPMILLIWQLGDRFLNHDVTTIAECELREKGRGFSVYNWRRMYEHRSKASLKATMLELQDGFRHSRDNGQPFEQQFVRAAGNAPPQVIAACVDYLQDDLFKSEVTKAFALRFADPVSTARNRQRNEWKENGHQRKKQKIENQDS